MSVPMVKLAIVTLWGRCHHAEGDHDEDCCYGGEEHPYSCTDYWPEGEDEE